MPDIRRASIKQLAHTIKDYGKQPRFAFFLGAGASRDSRINTASEMIRDFKKGIIQRCCPDDKKTDDEKESWLKGQDWYKQNGNEYCELFEQFEPKEIGRQRHIERMIDGRDPSFGYVVLANLMASNYINTIITTNFDDLVYSACTSYTSIRPIVYAYGVLASEMRITAQRPKILKLHGDYLYSTLKNTGTELAAQDPNMARQLMQVLNEYGLVVMGYGGNDKSVMDVLSQISARNDLYWCVMRGEEPNDAVKKLLEDKKGFLVEIEGFDKTMNEIRRIVEFDVTQMVGSIQDRQNQMIEKFKQFETNLSADILGEIAAAVKEQPAQQLPSKAIDSIAFFSDAYKAESAGNLTQAEQLYRQAIKLDPNYVAAYNDLGHLLSKDPSRANEAEAAFRKAIELDPNNAIAYYNLGTVLLKVPARLAEAEAAFRKAIELDPKDASAYTNLGTVLLKVPARLAEAEAAFRKAIELDPKDALAYSNLGGVLSKDPTRLAEAEATCRKAIELDPKDAPAYSNLGDVLFKDPTRANEAEAAFRKAIELDPKDALAYSNLGGVLSKDPTRLAEAEATCRKAIELDPKDAVAYNNLGTVVSKDPTRLAEAEAAFRKAIELDPSDASVYYNLACLESLRGNMDEAIENLRRAVQMDSSKRDPAKSDPDFENIRSDPRFKEIVGENAG
jgi:Flp pilus assembly protein TadD/CO dehydrogenase/acetyl-CoA synthase epsilon subunit